MTRLMISWLWGYAYRHSLKFELAEAIFYVFLIQNNYYILPGVIESKYIGDRIAAAA